MARDKNKNRLLQKVVRIGDKIDFKFSIADYGTDDDGPFSVVDVLGDEPDGVAGIVKEITPDSIRLGDWVEPGSVKEGDEHVPPPAAAQEWKEVPLSMDGSAKEPKPAAEPTKEEKVEKIAKKAREMKFKPIAPITVVEKLNVRLSEDEKREAAKLASELVGRVAQMKEELKSIQSSRKAEIKAVEEQIKRATDAHNSGIEYRSVTCEQRFDLEKSRTWFIYRDEVYGERPMNTREEKEIRNPNLFGEAPDLPNKVDPAALPSPKDLGGDQLAKKAAEEAELSKQVKEKKAKDAKAAKGSVDKNGESKDADVRQVMREEKSKKGGKRDHVAAN